MQHFESLLIADRFQRRRQLGRGTLGWMFAVWDEDRKEEVALRMVPNLPRPEDALARLASLASRLPKVRGGLIELYDCGFTDRHVWYSTALTTGEPLDRELFNGTALSPGIIARQVLAASETVARLHSLGLLHADLKLRNLFAGEDAESVLVAEAGVFLALFPPKLYSAASSPGFIAPEQVLGLPPIPESDIYSLGACLFALATKTVPAPGGRVPRICDTHSDFPESLDLIVQRATAREPKDRFPSAAELKVALREWTERNAHE